jgi:hypothetical protein
MLQYPLSTGNSTPPDKLPTGQNLAATCSILLLFAIIFYHEIEI